MQVLARNRRARAVGYGALSTAAMFSLFVEPATALGAQTPESLRYMWSSLFLVSALSCFFGAATDYWIFEYWGLKPLIWSLGILGVAFIGYSRTIGSATIPTGLSLIGVGLLFVGRYQDVKYIYRGGWQR